MIWATMTLGGCGFVLAHRYRDAIDDGLARLCREVRRLLEPPRAAGEDLRVAGRLISALQGGVSLDAALEDLAAESPPGSPVRGRLRGILDGRPGRDPLSTLLASSLASGAPALAGLRTLERAFRDRHRAALRAAALSAQCRAQAEVLGWFPWAVAVAVAGLDPSWLARAAGSSASWVLWGAGILLAGAGRRWITKALAGALEPRGETERLEEEELPELVLRLVGALAAGTDAETASEDCARQRPELARALAGAGEKAARLRSVLRHAARTGAPLREELGAFLQDLQAEIEARHEERAQRLPVRLLAPLFACLLPGALLVLAGFVWPLVVLP